MDDDCEIKFNDDDDDDEYIYYFDDPFPFYCYLEIFTFLEIIPSHINHLEYSLEVEVKGQNRFEQEKIFNKDRKSVKYTKSVSDDNQLISYPVRILEVFEEKQIIIFTVFEGSKNSSAEKNIFGSAFSTVLKTSGISPNSLDILNQDGIKVAKMVTKTIQTDDLKKGEISFQLRAYFEFLCEYSIQSAAIVLIRECKFLRPKGEIVVVQWQMSPIQSNNNYITLFHHFQNISTKHLFSNENEESKFKVKFILRGSNQQQDEYWFFVKQSDIKLNKLIDIEATQVKKSLKSTSFALSKFNCELLDIKIQENTFSDYVRNGINFNLIVGIDFSESIRDPINESSLSNTSSEHIKKNPQLQAIHIARNFLIKQGSNKEVSVEGLSGIPDLSDLKENIHDNCFPIFQYKLYPELKNVSEIFQEYFNIFDNNQVELGGKTQLKPLLENAYRKATQGKDESKRNYYILLIITNGVCHDFSETIKQIKLCGDLPLSIIIVGVGNENFKEMRYLSDSIEGTYKFVSFVKMSDFQEGNEEEFSSKMFKKVQSKLEDYYQAHPIDIRNPLTDQDQQCEVDCQSKEYLEYLFIKQQEQMKELIIAAVEMKLPFY